MGKSIKCLYIEEFDKVEKFLTENFSSPTHYKEWNLVVSNYFKTEFFYFACLDKNKIIGVCPVHRYKNEKKNRIVSGPKEFMIPYGGWIFSEGRKIDSGYFPIRKNENLEIYSLPLLEEFKSVYEGIKVIKNYKTAIINLRKSEEEIWNNLDQKRRNMIRKAMKNHVQITYLQNENLKEFYTFYSTANDQYGLKNMPFGYFRDLVFTPGNIKVDILAAKFEDNVLGYNVIISDKNYSLYWLGIRKKETENNGFFDLLQWESIKRAKERNCLFYDLCYVEKERLPNIYKFKTDYCKDEYDVLNMNKKPVVFRIINKIQKIF
jgi:hypothetical protein